MQYHNLYRCLKMRKDSFNAAWRSCVRHGREPAVDVVAVVSVTEGEYDGRRLL